jgi:hypothetical protein
MWWCAEDYEFAASLLRKAKALCADAPELVCAVLWCGVVRCGVIRSVLIFVDCVDCGVPSSVATAHSDSEQFGVRSAARIGSESVAPLSDARSGAALCRRLHSAPRHHSPQRLRCAQRHAKAQRSRGTRRGGGRLLSRRFGRCCAASLSLSLCSLLPELHFTLLFFVCIALHCMCCVWCGGAPHQTSEEFARSLQHSAAPSAGSLTPDPHSVFTEHVVVLAIAYHNLAVEMEYLKQEKCLKVKNRPTFPLQTRFVCAHFMLWCAVVPSGVHSGGAALRLQLSPAHHHFSANLSERTHRMGHERAVAGGHSLDDESAHRLRRSQ